MEDTKDTIIYVLGWIAFGYVALVYLGSKLFPRSENVSSSDPRFQSRQL